MSSASFMQKLVFVWRIGLRIGKLSHHPVPFSQLKPAMPDQPTPLTREDRLAAKLRENLRRRKAQARAMDAEPAQDEPANPALSKPPPKS